MSKGPESKIVKKIKDAILEEYPQALVLKIHGSQYQEAGIPDLLCCINGYFFGFEVKQPGKESTPIQKHMRRRIIIADGEADQVTRPQEALSRIRQRVNERKNTANRK